MFIIFYSSISPAGGGLFVYSVQPFQFHPIKHPRLFTSCPVSHHPNHQAVYPWDSGTPLIFSRLRFNQLEGDTVDGGCNAAQI